MVGHSPASLDGNQKSIRGPLGQSEAVGAGGAQCGFKDDEDRIPRIEAACWPKGVTARGELHFFKDLDCNARKHLACVL